MFRFYIFVVLLINVCICLDFYYLVELSESAKNCRSAILNGFDDALMVCVG